MNQIEYLEVDCSVEQLNVFGAEGWRPATLRWVEGRHRDSWVGLLWRYAPKKVT